MIFNQFKTQFNLNNPNEIPTYIFEGSSEEYNQLKKEGKLFINKNVFKIDPKVIK